VDDLLVRLRTLFQSPQIRLLAQLAPLGVVASGASTVIGVVITSPSLAATRLGALLTGLATNITSALLYDVIKPGQDDQSRQQAIITGLKTRDPAVVRLVAEALIEAGPALAQALPEDARADLIAVLAQGMREPGGALAEIAASYSAALRNPGADWHSLQNNLRQAVVLVKQTIEASDDAEISSGGQRVEGVTGPVEQAIRATGRSRIVDASQTAVSDTWRERAEPVTGRAARSSPSTDADQLRRLIAISTRRLHELEAQAALTGIQTPPAITLEITDLRDEIARLQEQLTHVDNR
jgi:hypothetical protein